jgi:uncharacterized protein YjbI with pentapeptide repeats
MNQSLPRKVSLFTKLLAVIHLVALIVGVPAAWSETLTLPNSAQLTPAETWVLAKVVAGQVADLQEAFGPEEGPRRLRAPFVAALLTNTLPGVKVHRSGLYIVNAVVTEPLSLEFAEVPHAVFLVSCRFQDPANFSGAIFKKSLALKQAHFTGPVNSYRLKVEVDAFFGGTVFQGSVNFGGADVGGTFTLSGARFADREQEANFNGLKVGQTLALKQTVFAGPVDFTGARVGSELNAARSRFDNPNGKAIFNGIKVSQNTSFLHAVFAGPVDFGGADIGGEFFADGAQFTSQDQLASFNSTRISQRASFDGTVFQGPVDFTQASIGGMLIFSQAKFLHPDSKANFSGLKVEQHAFFSDTSFQGGVSLVGAQLKHLMLNGRPEAPITYTEVNLDGAQIDFSLILGDLIIETLQATRLRVNGPAIFKNVHITGRSDLRDCNFAALKFIGVKWPEHQNSLWIEGLTYQSLSAGEGPDDWRKLLAWLDQSRFDTRSYNQLEDFYKRGGYGDRADEIYIQANRRETLEKWWRPTNLATLIFWDTLTGYGRKPSRTFWISLAIVLIGCFVFDPKMFESTYLENWTWLSRGTRFREIAVRFFLSLDEFLPGVDLGLAKLWQISRISFRKLVYYHFHKICGWILIPIGLAAIFSKFK